MRASGLWKTISLPIWWRAFLDEVRNETSWDKILCAIKIVEKVIVCTFTQEQYEFQRKKWKTYCSAASAILFVWVTNGVILPFDIRFLFQLQLNTFSRTWHKCSKNRYWEKYWIRSNSNKSFKKDNKICHMLRFGSEYPSQRDPCIGRLRGLPSYAHGRDGYDACRVTTHGHVPEGRIWTSNICCIFYHIPIYPKNNFHRKCMSLHP
jgi:hypothetical protein